MSVFNLCIKDAMSDFLPQIFQRASPALTKESLIFTFNGQEP